jgi:phosphatidylglycerophosphatase A
MRVSPSRSRVLSSLVASLIGTWFGCGLSPRAPGTVGSLGTLPLHLLLCRAPLALHAAAIAVTVVAGTWAAQRIADDRAESDPQRVVIDEVAGTLIALSMVRDRAWFIQALAFVLFRVFDIWKPGPIRHAERLPPAGVGIMADDVLAGLCAGLLALAAAQLF